MFYLYSDLHRFLSWAYNLRILRNQNIFINLIVFVDCLARRKKYDLKKNKYYIISYVTETDGMRSLSSSILAKLASLIRNQ